MKIGSLVISLLYDNGLRYFNGNYLIHPIDEGIILTVREISHDIDGSLGLLFEEIINDNAPNNEEWGYCIENFKEIQPPLNIEEFITEILHL